MAKSVWIVFEGIYSDRHIVYVASTKEQAELYNSKVSSEELEILEFPIDDDIESNCLYKCTVLLDKGLVIPEHIHVSLVSDYETTVLSEEYAPGNIIIVRNRMMGAMLHLIIPANDAKHAQKIAHEWMTMIIATPFAYPEIFDNNVRRAYYNFYTKEFKEY